MELTDTERREMIGRIEYGIRRGANAVELIGQSPTVGGQFVLDLENMEEAAADVKKRFTNRVSSETT